MFNGRGLIVGFCVGSADSIQFGIHVQKNIFLFRREAWRGCDRKCLHIFQTSVEDIIVGGWNCDQVWLVPVLALLAYQGPIDPYRPYLAVLIGIGPTSTRMFNQDEGISNQRVMCWTKEHRNQKVVEQVQ